MGVSKVSRRLTRSGCCTFSRTPSSWVTWSRFINFLFTNLVATARLVPFWSHFFTTENLPLEDRLEAIFGGLSVSWGTAVALNGPDVRRPPAPGHRPGAPGTP